MKLRFKCLTASVQCIREFEATKSRCFCFFGVVVEDESVHVLFLKVSSFFTIFSSNTLMLHWVVCKRCEVSNRNTSFRKLLYTTSTNTFPEIFDIFRAIDRMLYAIHVLGVLHNYILY